MPVIRSAEKTMTTLSCLMRDHEIVIIAIVRAWENACNWVGVEC